MNGESDAYTPFNELMTVQIIEKIEALSDDIRVPFELHLEGFKYKEIADQLNIPIGTVKSRVFNARKVLSKELSE
jgi:RNA polymerase sigma-70 factor (ECF subfamily)